MMTGNEQGKSNYRLLWLTSGTDAKQKSPKEDKVARGNYRQRKKSMTSFWERPDERLTREQIDPDQFDLIEHGEDPEQGVTFGYPEPNIRDLNPKPKKKEEPETPKTAVVKRRPAKPLKSTVSTDPFAMGDPRYGDKT